VDPVSSQLNPNLAARLVERAARHPDRPALIERTGGRVRRVSFGELAAGAAVVAAALHARGVGTGDRVVLFVPMSIDLYWLLLACFHLGATAVFVDAWAGRTRLEAAVGAARPRAFVGIPRAHLLRLLSPALRAIPIRVVASRGWMERARLPTLAAAPPVAVVEPEAPALVTFTTGSTGRIKAAARSHAFLWAQHEVLAEHLGLTGEDVDMPTLPVFVLNNLATGTPSVLPDFDPRRPADIDAAAVYRQMVAEGVTTTTGSPAFYGRLASWCLARGLRLPLRALFTGGAPVSPPLARLLQRVVAGRVEVVYGSTEAEPIAGIDVTDMLRAMERDPHGAPPDGLCAGAPVPRIAVRLVRPWDGPICLGEEGWRGWEVTTGEVGEVVVSGDHVLPGYLDDPEGDRAHKVREGERVWHRTGDAARFDALGRLWLMGRVNQRVRRAGRVWWSTAAELRALAVEGVGHAVYFGLPDPGLGQRAVLCVETARGRLDEAGRSRLRSALDPMPVDEVLALRHIPRDPRHRSKTDMEALMRRIGPVRSR
jgi:acyl-CoA synthetase (AMP-forming)/AMP-acid ligase II